MRRFDSDDPQAWDEALRPRLRLDEVVARAAAEVPDRTAVVDEAGSATYREFDGLIDDLADAMRARGVQPGERIATLVSAGNLGTALMYAISRAGAVSVPINEMHSAPEVADVLRRGGARYFIADARLGAAGSLGSQAFELLPEAQRPARAVIGDEPLLRWTHEGSVPVQTPVPDTVAVILFTSGSTNRPKGVLVTHEGLVGIAHYCALGLALTPEDRYLDMMPAYHVGGIASAILPVHLTGGALVIARFAPERIFEFCERERITTLAGFGPMFETLFNSPSYSPARHPQWRTVGVSQTSEHLLQQFRDIGITRIGYGLGMTEGSGDYIVSRPWLPDEEAVESCGLPSPGIDVRIVDPDTDQVLPQGAVGEIRFKGWSTCEGYIDGSDDLDDDGYWKTGDLGRIRPSGTVQFMGRIKFMVKSGGENISAHEVEQVLTAFPEIEEAVIVGVPDTRWGEKAVAFVSFSPGAALGAQDVKDRCRGQLAAYKIPKEILTIGGDEWPLMAVGKIDRPRLTSMAADRLAVSQV